jgi:hypothetical protein
MQLIELLGVLRVSATLGAVKGLPMSVNADFAIHESPSFIEVFPAYNPLQYVAIRLGSLLANSDSRVLDRGLPIPAT